MVAIRQILCPVDFSEFSRHAIERSVAIARSHGAAVTALHVLHSPSAGAAVHFGPEGPGSFALHGAERDRAFQEMKRFVAAVAAEGVHVEASVVEAATPYQEILSQADRLKADLIVIGTHGRSGFERLLMGSTTEKVLRRSAVPVLTVPGAAATDTPVPFTRILCAVDFSDCSRAALRYAAALAGEASTRLTVLHVLETLPVMYEPNMAVPFDFAQQRPELERVSREYLHRFVSDTLPQAEVDQVVASGKPYAEILGAAVERQSDLIVLGVHGHHVLDRLLFGSTAGHVVRGAACPVLTVRAPAAKA